jgi:EpsD family peptidyl-prolyl cis-trans isomerase
MTQLYRSACTLMVGTFICVGTLELAACGSKDAPKPVTQVAAKVGKEEISLLQINVGLGRGNARGTTPEQERLLSRNVLEGLIDQQVAVNQAIELKLNHDPDVMAQIDAATRSVLANAYVKQYVLSLPKAEPQDASKYFDEHPALFSERRIYTVQEVLAPRSAEVLEQFNRMAVSNQSMEDVTAWLKTRQVNVNPVVSSRSAEQIPMDLLPRISALRDGQDLVFATPTSVSILRLLSSRTEPVPKALALPRIEQFLGTQRIENAITEQMKALRAKANVVYMGEFAQTAAAPAAPPAAPPAASPAAAASVSVSSTVEKGIAGLK